MVQNDAKIGSTTLRDSPGLLRRTVRPHASFSQRRHTCLPNPQRKAQDPPTMPRDTSNTTTKARNSKYAAATGLKTGNLKVKGAPPEPLSQRRRD